MKTSAHLCTLLAGTGMLLLAGTTPAAEQQDGAPVFCVQKSVLTLKQAQLLAGAAERQGLAVNQTLSIVVMDAFGHVRLAQHHEDEPLETLAYAEAKARRALVSQKPTHQLNDGKHEIAYIAGQMYVAGIGGGFPLIISGNVVGAMAVSGAPHEVDRDIVQAALREASKNIPGLQTDFQPPKASK